MSPPVSSSRSALGSDTTPLPSWAALNSSTWGSLKQALKGLSVEFALLADKAAQQVSGAPAGLRGAPQVHGRLPERGRCSGVGTACPHLFRVAPRGRVLVAKQMGFWS